MKLFYKKYKRLCICSAIGFFAVCLAGVLLHFTYGWTNQNYIVGLFSPVNESIWEHMKLIYFPMLIFFMIEYVFLYRSMPRLFRADIIGILTGTLLIPVIFYTSLGILGAHYLALDILIFIICAAVGFYARGRSLLLPGRKKYTFFYFLCTLALGVCFLIFTYYPPSISLFAAP